MTTAEADDRVDAILETIRLEQSAVASGDTAAYIELLTDDAEFMPPNGHARTGDALRGWLADFLRGFQIEWLEFASTACDAAGDLAYHTFTYTWRVTPRGAPGTGAVSSGKGLHVLRRQPDGRWKLAREIWNSTPEA